MSRTATNASPVTIGSLILDTLRAERASAFPGSHWSRNTRLAEGMLCGRMLRHGIEPADRALASEQLLAVMDAARDAAKGVDQRYAYAIRLTLHAMQVAS